MNIDWGLVGLIIAGVVGLFFICFAWAIIEEEIKRWRQK